MGKIVRVYTVSTVCKNDRGLTQEHKTRIVAPDARRRYTYAELTDLIADAFAQAGHQLTDTERATMIVRKTKVNWAFSED